MRLLSPASLGTEAVRQALVELDPEHAAGYNRVFGTPGQKYPDSNAPNYPVEGALEQIVANQNELDGLVASLREEIRLRPFG